jgi:hypothetical protein
MRHRLSPCSSTAFTAAAILLLTAAAPAYGQMQAGIVRDARSQSPLACVHVSLVDSAGNAVRHTVTDSLGQFYLDAPKPGAYRVRLSTFGWQPFEGPLDTLADVDFKQGSYSVAFTDLPQPIQLDSLSYRLIPVEKRSDRATVDSLLAPRRRFAEELRRREDVSGWKSRRIEPRSAMFRYPEGLRRAGIGGGAIVRFIVDSTGRARRESWSVIKTSHEGFAQVLRSFLDARWTPSSNGGQPVCELVQYYVHFEFDTRYLPGRMAAIVIMNE